MRLQILEMPDEMEDRKRWLEQQLAGLELPSFVRELVVVHGVADSVPTLDAACGEYLAVILERGLAEVPADVIQTLLTNPRLLLELQDRISMDGGEYWLDVPLSEAHHAAVERGLLQLRAALELSAAEAPPTAATNLQGSSKPTVTANERSGRQKSPSRTLFRVVFAACVLMLAVGISWLFTPKPTGWADPGRLTSNRSPSQVFVSLEEATGSYSNAPRDTSQQLEGELQRFIRDCQRIQKLDLTVLAAIPHPDRNTPGSMIATYADWLTVKCKAWEGKAATVLASLRDGSANLETAERDYTAIIENLKKALKSQASALTKA